MQAGRPSWHEPAATHALHGELVRVLPSRVLQEVHEIILLADVPRHLLDVAPRVGRLLLTASPCSANAPTPSMISHRPRRGVQSGRSRVQLQLRRGGWAPAAAAAWRAAACERGGRVLPGRAACLRAPAAPNVLLGSHPQQRSDWRSAHAATLREAERPSLVHQQSRCVARMRSYDAASALPALLGAQLPPLSPR